MPLPDPAVVNGFARGLSKRFASEAKGLGEGFRRFLGARPYERILAGFLTPLGADGDDAGIGDEMGLPELPPDEPYEQTNVGFEWSVPTGVPLDGLVMEVRVTMCVFVRVLPTLTEMQANARFDRQGQAVVPEVWECIPLAGQGAPDIPCPIDLAGAVSGGAKEITLGNETAAAWLRTGKPEGPLYPGRRALTIQQSDLSDAGAYSSWIATLQRPAGNQPPGWLPVLDIRAFPSPTEPGAMRLLLRLVNKSRPVDKRSAAFIDPRLYAVGLSAGLPARAHQDSEFRTLPASYRYDRRLSAVGINCQPRVERLQERVFISAETVPSVETPRLVPREVPEGEPYFRELTDFNRGAAVLKKILAAMKEYDRTDWERKVRSLAAPDEIRDADQDRETFRLEISDFEAGITLLTESTSSPPAIAFRLMNETMYRVGRVRRRQFDKWHLFQIVFIVSMIPRLMDAAEGNSDGLTSPLNILWFPAGGGKTEAFSGLLVWHALYDRLRGKDFGVTAFLRYPLRLLTYQQLQRISWVLGQAEEVRREAGLAGHPFSLGYYVGESTTPNSISSEQDRKLRSAGVPATWQRVFQCPSCGKRTVAVRYNPALRLIEHYCEAPDCRTAGGRLPVYVVDDDLYRYLPTVIVSTVDKLAQLGQNRRFSQLLGRVDLFCPIHGAAFKGSNRFLCEASRELRAGRPQDTCSGEPVARGPFPLLAPSLHVQDEMHLLRESLATLDSHYETAALELQRSFSENRAQWRLIGSTATIEGYREQARHLYLRSATRFPAPGPEAYESFYYTTDPALIGRIYLGVFGVGRTHTPSVARTISLLYKIVERVRSLLRTDLDAARRYIDLARASAADLHLLVFLYEIVLTYVLTRKGSDQVGEAIDTRVRRDIEQIAGSNLRVETFNSNVDMPRMISIMEEIESAEAENVVVDRVRGVVATNIISHGVDIDRFNIMVFAGLPRQMAEYIQASARVGRQLPGISVLVVTPQGERDRSVFDRFEKFHQYVDRLVEPVPINRWSEPALALTLRGILAAYVMGVAPTRLGQELYLVGHVRDLFGRPSAEALNEAEVVEWVLKAVGADSTAAPRTFSAVARRLASRYYGQVTGASQDHDREPLNTFLGAMRSLRDVDDPAWIAVMNEADAQTLSVLSL